MQLGGGVFLGCACTGWWFSLALPLVVPLFLCVGVLAALTPHGLIRPHESNSHGARHREVAPSLALYCCALSRINADAFVCFSQCMRWHVYAVHSTHGSLWGLKSCGRAGGCHTVTLDTLYCREAVLLCSTERPPFIFVPRSAGLGIVLKTAV